MQIRLDDQVKAAVEAILKRGNDAEVVIVADPFMNEKMEEWAKSIGIERCSKDPEDVFSADDVDAVFICSSTNTHAEFMIRAAKAALRQIEDMGYALPFLIDHRKLYSIRVSFDSKKRMLTDWKVTEG